MTSTNKTGILVAAAATMVVGAWHTLSAHAETVVVDDQVMVRKSDLPRPAAGMSMTAVEAKFGMPRERHPTVGKPPITRWDYEHFAVFFEKDRVIDSVVTSDDEPSPAATPQPTPAAPAPPATASVPAPLA